MINFYMEAKNKKSVIIVSPSLDPTVNVSGVSSVVNFIVSNNKNVNYIHFQQGKADKESGGTITRLKRVINNFFEWKTFLSQNSDALIHYNLSMDTNSILRDVPFIVYAYKKNRNIVAHIHGGKYLFQKDRPWIIKKFLNKLFSMDISFLVLSDREKNVLDRDYCKRNIHVLPNVIDLTEAKGFNRILNPNRLDILFLGRIIEEKGIEFILSACKELKRRNLNFVLHIAGKETIPGLYLKHFEESLGDKFFRYEGIVSGINKTELLKKCNVFLLPSYYEGLPMSLLEAMSFGEIPVVTNVGSIGKVVVDGDNGIFVDVKDSKSIVKAIDRLFKDENLLFNLSKKARNTIFERFNPKEYIDKLNMIYASTPPKAKFREGLNS